MTTVTLIKIELIDSPKRQVKEWGERLIASYRLEVEFEFDNKLLNFIWVLAENNAELPITEYDDDFEDFLVAICNGESFNKCKSFINEIQERFSLAVHYFHSGNKEIEIQLPLQVSR